MLFLGQLFRVRGKVHGEEEKPFLDHLEDLRVMITRVVITLVLSTIICWVFHKTIIDVITKPVHEVWNTRQEKKLPDGIGIDEWEKIKKIQIAATQLAPEQRESYYASFDDEHMQLRAECAGYYRTALLIEDKERRKQWISELPQLDDDRRELIYYLLEKEPAAEVNAKGKVVDMKALKPTETFMLAFKLAFFSGVVISFPFNLWFILQFVLPGLRNNEKKVMWPAMLVGFGLFLAGVLFSYFIVLPRALDFFFSFGTGMGVQNEWRIGHYTSFVTQFTLIFGLAFELPVVVMTIVKLGLVGYQAMANTRSYAVLAIVVIAAAITPTTDVLTLLMLAVPMYILYEICIILAYFDHRKKVKEEEQEYERTGVRKTPAVIPAAGALTIDSGDDEEDYSDDFDDEDEQLAEDEAAGDEGDSDSYEENVKDQQAESGLNGKEEAEESPEVSYKVNSEEEFDDSIDSEKKGDSDRKK